MEKYCTKMMANDGGDNDNEALTQIDMDSENICELYWFVQYLFRQNSAQKQQYRSTLLSWTVNVRNKILFTQ